MPFKYEDGGQTMSFKYVDADVDACTNVYQHWISFLGSTVYIPKIKKVIFNGPATIILWSDESKTVVKCMDGETFDKEKGFAMAMCKKLFGKNFHKMFKEWCSK